MAAKILVNYPGSLGNDALASKRQSVADQLGVCPEDIIFRTDGVSISVVDIPDGMTKAREKADRQAEKDAQKAEAEAQAQAADDARAEADAIRVLQQAAPVRVNLPPDTPDGRRKEELTEQHSTDVRREVAGVAPGGPTATPAGDEKNPRRDADEKRAAERDAAKAAKAPADYDSWTAEELHAEAAKRDLHGRSGLDKAGLVKALQKHDKAK